MRIRVIVVLAVAAMVLGGCQAAAKRASQDYYQRKEFQKPQVSLTSVGVQERSAPVSEEDIAEALKQTADLRVPMKLAFFEVAGVTDVRTRQSLKQLPPDKREAWAKKLLDSNLYTAAEEVPGILLPATFELRALRLAAAQQGADVLLVYATNTDMHHYSNALWVTYLLVVPIWLAPGSHADAFTALSAALIDVKSGKILTGFSTVGESRQVYPYGFEDRGERRAVVGANLGALDQMADRLTAFAKIAAKK